MAKSFSVYNTQQYPPGLSCSPYDPFGIYNTQQGPTGPAGPSGPSGSNSGANSGANLFMINETTLQENGPVDFKDMMETSQFKKNENSGYVYSGEHCFMSLKFNIKYTATTSLPYEIIKIKIEKIGKNKTETILDMKYGYEGGLVISDDIITYMKQNDVITLSVNDISPIYIKDGSFLLLQKI
jgi:hypothetical protein